MINMTDLELMVYEVDQEYYDDEGNHIDTESEYVVVDPRDDKDIYDVVTHVLFSDNPDWKPQNMKVCVYEARWADFRIQLHKSGKIEFESDGEIDTSTGCNGSSIFTLVYDKEGNIVEE